MLVGAIMLHDIFYSSLIVEIIAAIIGLALMVPTASVTVRRLHDIKKSGYWAVPFFLFPFFPEALLYKFNPLILTKLSKR